MRISIDKYYNGHTIFSILIIIFLLIGCKETKPSEENEITKQEYISQMDMVEIQMLKKKDFNEELLANGRLVALQKSVLKFEIDGLLDKLNVQNGDYVNKGETLASLNAFTYQQALDKAQIAIQKSELEFRDMLIGRGYDFDNPDIIPKNIYNMVSIRSGYQEADYQLKDARFRVSSSILKAPFHGKVAGIKYKQYEHINAGIEFLVLINDSVFEVEFYLIESEINKIKVGEHVTVLAFSSGMEYKGAITSVNPQVEENGTVLVKARIKNNGKLMEGMNVKVRIQNNLPDQYVVPKSAVILRQNQEVIFKYKNGKAFWTYIKTTHENSSMYAIIADPEKSSANLSIGDTVIISGNLNLAHNSEVTIKP